MCLRDLSLSLLKHEGFWLFALLGRTQPPYEMHWASAREQAPSGRFKVETEADIRVDVRAQIVEVHRSHARIGGVVPIPKTDRNALTDRHYSCFTGCAPSRWDLIHPPSNFPTSSILSIHRVYFL